MSKTGHIAFWFTSVVFAINSDAYQLSEHRVVLPAKLANLSGWNQRLPNRRQHDSEIQYLMASITKEQCQEFGQLVEPMARQIETPQFLSVRSFDEFLEKKFPESRRKAYYLMAIHEHLTPIRKRELEQIGWTKARELVCCPGNTFTKSL